MASVYSGSIVTVAVAEAASISDGFFNKRYPLQQCPCHLISDEATSLVIERCSSLSRGGRYTWCDEMSVLPGETPLDKRGWVYQERALSPRTLYYGRYGAHWECCEGTLCENHPSLDSPEPIAHTSAHSRTKLRIRDLQSTRSVAPLTTDPSAQDVSSDIAAWNLVVSEYCGTSLTYHQDKLAALAGLAQPFYTRWHMQASFGVCQNVLVRFYHCPK